MLTVIGKQSTQGDRAWKCACCLCLFSLSVAGGIVNLACAYPRGKVAIKARSARTTSRLYVGFLLRGNPGLILQDSFS